MNYLYFIILIAILFLVGIRIVRSTQRGLNEKLGKYYIFANPGFHWIIPIIDRLFLVNVTEQMVDAEPQYRRYFKTRKFNNEENLIMHYNERESTIRFWNRYG
jgi:regulator of protease activity HflC (stomatin/prohibitin superfamily)